jgi:hypothetical protein
MAIAGAPRTTMSLIAFLNNIMDFKACYNKSSIFFRRNNKRNIINYI